MFCKEVVECYRKNLECLKCCLEGVGFMRGDLKVAYIHLGEAFGRSKWVAVQKHWNRLVNSTTASEEEVIVYFILGRLVCYGNIFFLKSRPCLAKMVKVEGILKKICVVLIAKSNYKDYCRNFATVCLFLQIPHLISKIWNIMWFLEVKARQSFNPVTLCCGDAQGWQRLDY